MDFSSQLLQFFLSGITLGGFYALVALGFVIIYNVSGIINFAQGEFVMLGALFMVTLTKAGVPGAPAFVLAILAVMVLGGAIERLAIRPAKNASIVTLIIITIGLSITVRGIALLIWGTDPYSLAPFTEGDPLTLAGATIMPQSLWVLAVTMLVVISMYIFFEWTYWGKAVRACVINKLAASLMGISTEKMSRYSFMFSAGIGALAGIVITPTTSATYDMGLLLGLKGFIAAVLGGLTSAPGAVLGGFILGLTESFGAGLISSGYKDAISFVILLAVLLIKPSGLFGVFGSKRV
jgi:branched-chain amino acid transport system permease protein